MLVLYMLHTSETGILRFNEIRRLMSPEGHLKRKSTCEELVSA
jgi:hypothetical protein